MSTSPSVLDFGPLSIRYDSRVLEPRPWTVAQSRWAAELLQAGPPGDVLELCSGAGHIGLLAMVDSSRRLVMVDDNPVACDFARRNAEAHGLAEVQVRCSRVETALEPREHFALVIADPPWVPSASTDQFPADPPHAIDGGTDGLTVARSIVSLATRHLVEGGSLVLQLGSLDQAELLAAEHATVARAADQAWEWKEFREFPRGVLAHLRHTRALVG